MSGDEPGAEGRKPRAGSVGRRPAVSAATFAGLGLQFAAAILLFLYAGQWLDRRLGTSPVFLLLGVFVGAGGAFYGLYRRLMSAQRDDADGR